MTALPKTSIKAYFQTGDLPTQSNFSDLVDSYQNVGHYLTGVSAATTNGIVLFANTSGGTTQQATGTGIVNVINGVYQTPIATTGTGNNVLATGPTIVSAALTSPSATNATLTNPTLGAASATSIIFPSGGNTALTWYEEGTFIPTFLGLSTAGSPTYTNQTGVFQRIGKLVHFAARLQISALGGMSGQLAMAGLPYAVGTVAQGFSSGELINAAANTYSLVLEGQAGGTQVYVFKQASTGTIGFDSASDATANLRMWIAGCYSI